MTPLDLMALAVLAWLVPPLDIAIRELLAWPGWRD